MAEAVAHRLAFVPRIALEPQRDRRSRLQPCPPGGYVVKVQRGRDRPSRTRPPPGEPWFNSTLSVWRLGPLYLRSLPKAYQCSRKLSLLIDGALVYPDELEGGRFSGREGALTRYTIWHPSLERAAVLPHPTRAFFDGLKENLVKKLPFIHKRKRHRAAEPVCAALPGPDGVVHMYSKIEWRYFYSVCYEQLVELKDDYARFRAAAQGGYPLLFLSFGAPRVDFGDLTQGRALALFEDPDVNWTHTLILACMLALPEKEDRPWHVWADVNPGVYFPLTQAR